MGGVPPTCHEVGGRGGRAKLFFFLGSSSHKWEGCIKHCFALCMEFSSNIISYMENSLSHGIAFGACVCVCGRGLPKHRTRLSDLLLEELRTVLQTFHSLKVLEANINIYNYNISFMLLKKAQMRIYDIVRNNISQSLFTSRFHMSVLKSVYYFWDVSPN